MKLYLLPLPLLPLLTTGCVDGKLNPAVAPIVTVLDEVACSFVPASSHLGPLSGPEVCAGLATIINRILGAVSLPPGGTVPGQLTVAYRGKVIAKKLTAGQANALRVALGKPEIAAAVDAELGK